MNKKKIFGSLGGLLLIGALTWYFFPMMLFGFNVTKDHLNNQKSAKDDIQAYINQQHGDTLTVKGHMYDGEASNGYLVALSEDDEHGEAYKVYYDLKEDVVVFDEYAVEKDKERQPLPDKDVYAHIEDEIRLYENLSYVYEKELKDARLEQKNDKIERIEADFDKINGLLGLLYHVQANEWSNVQTTEGEG